MENFEFDLKNNKLIFDSFVVSRDNNDQNKFFPSHLTVILFTD